MKITFIIFICFLCKPAYSIGFWDDFLTNGFTKSEYPIGKGTGSDFLALDYVTDNLPGAEGCQFDSNISFSGCPGRAGLPMLPGGSEIWQGTIQRLNACGGDTTRIGDSWLGCLSYDQSPYFEIGTPNVNYWVIHANDDPSFDRCNGGIPGLSHPILPFNSVANGIYKIGMLDFVNETKVRKKMQFGIYNSQHDFFCNSINGFNFSIPFLSIGAQNNRGNGQKIGNFGAVNKSNTDLLQFDIKISSYVPFDCPDNITAECVGSSFKGSHAGVYIIAKWADVNHLLFLELFRSGVVDTLSTPSNSFWNWPVKDSFFYPGANIVTFTAENNLLNNCNVDYVALDPSSNDVSTYQIDVGGLFRCAKDLGYYPDLPINNVDIEGIHWFIETLGFSGELSLEVSSIHMTTNKVFSNGFE